MSTVPSPATLLAVPAVLSSTTDGTTAVSLVRTAVVTVVTVGNKYATLSLRIAVPGASVRVSVREKSLHMPAVGVVSPSLLVATIAWCKAEPAGAVVASTGAPHSFRSASPSSLPV